MADRHTHGVPRGQVRPAALENFGNFPSIFDVNGPTRSVTEQSRIGDDYATQLAMELRDSVSENENYHTLAMLPNVLQDQYDEINMVWIHMGEQHAKFRPFRVLPIEWTQSLVIRVRQYIAHLAKFTPGAEGTPVTQPSVSMRKTIFKLTRYHAGISTFWEQFITDPTEFRERMKETGYAAAHQLDVQTLIALMAMESANVLMARNFAPSATAFSDYVARSSENFIAASKSAQCIENYLAGCFALCEQYLGYPQMDTLILPSNLTNMLQQHPTYRIYKEGGVPGGTGEHSVIRIILAGRELEVVTYSGNPNMPESENPMRSTRSISNFYVSASLPETIGSRDIEIVDHALTHDWVTITFEDMASKSGLFNEDGSIAIQSDGGNEQKREMLRIIENAIQDQAGDTPLEKFVNANAKNVKIDIDFVVVARDRRLRTDSAILMKRGSETGNNFVTLPLIGRGEYNYARKADCVLSFYTAPVIKRQNNIMPLPHILACGIEGGWGHKIDRVTGTEETSLYANEFDEDLDGDLLVFPILSKKRIHQQTTIISKAIENKTDFVNLHDKTLGFLHKLFASSRYQHLLEQNAGNEAVGDNNYGVDARTQSSFAIQRGTYRYLTNQEFGSRYVVKKNTGALGCLDMPGDMSRRLRGSYSVSFGKSSE